MLLPYNPAEKGPSYGPVYGTTLSHATAFDSPGQSYLRIPYLAAHYGDAERFALLPPDDHLSPRGPVLRSACLLHSHIGAAK